MKKSITIFAVSLLFTTQLMSSSGGITGRTTTGCTCHGTFSAGNSVIVISSSPDIFSVTGFAVGNTYQLTITLMGGPAGTTGGFNLKASVGTFNNPSANAKLQSGEITHKNASARTWTVDWVAPTTETDSVVFNFAGNAANGNGDSSGDDPTLTSRKAAYKTTAILEKDILVINSFRLLQNYPNPFNFETSISYQINIAGEVQLKIFDMRGQEIFAATHHHDSPGNYHFSWNARNLDGLTIASGIYVYQITFNHMTRNRKLILLK